MTLQLPKNKSNSKKWCIPVVTLNTWYIYTWQKTTFFPQIFNGQLRLKLIFKAISGIYIPHNEQITANFVIYLMAGDYTGDTLWDFGNIYQKTKKSK